MQVGDKFIATQKNNKLVTTTWQIVEKIDTSFKFKVVNISGHSNDRLGAEQMVANDTFENMIAHDFNDLSWNWKFVPNKWEIHKQRMLDATA